MSVPQMTTDVTLKNGSRYMIRRIKSREGSYISNLLLTKMVPQMAMPLMALGGGPQSGSPSMSPDEWTFVQGRMLSLCSKYDSSSPLPLPILNATGAFTAPELEYDSAAVMELTAKAIGFNFHDFFGREGMSLASTLANITGQSFTTSPPSTSTSGDPSSPDSGPTPTS